MQIGISSVLSLEQPLDMVNALRYPYIYHKLSCCLIIATTALLSTINIISCDKKNNWQVAVFRVRATPDHSEKI